MIVELYGRSIVVDHPSNVGKRRWLGEMSPEPETVEWIESLQPGEVFYDIGANVGTFSVRAALRGLRVFSFEPVAENFDELHRVVTRNNLSSVTVFRMALSNFCGSGVMAAGRSNATLYREGVGQFTSVSTLDQLVLGADYLQPDHIKLDVDGNELEILQGAVKTLQAVKSVLVEIDPKVPKHGTIPAFMKKCGFTFNPDQVLYYKIRDDEKYFGTGNWIFRRK